MEKDGDNCLIRYSGIVNLREEKEDTINFLN